MKKIYDERRDMLRIAVEEMSDRSIRITQDSVRKDWEVSWSNIGPRDAVDTKMFGEMLGTVAELVERLNRHVIEFVRTDDGDPELEAGERWNTVLDYVVEWLEKKDFDKIEKWLLAGGIGEYEKLDALLTPGAEEAKNDELIQEILAGEFDPSNNFMVDIMERKMNGSITEDEVLAIARREFDRGNVYKDLTQGVYREVGSGMYICPIEPEPETPRKIARG